MKWICGGSVKSDILRNNNINCWRHRDPMICHLQNLIYQNTHACFSFTDINITVLISNRMVNTYKLIYTHTHTHIHLVRSIIDIARTYPSHLIFQSGRLFEWCVHIIRLIYISYHRSVVVVATGDVRRGIK